MIDTNVEITLRRDVLLTFQVALLGMVDQRLRGVTVSWDVEKVRGRLFFDGPIGDVEVETASDIEAEIMASFPGHQVSVTSHRCDAPADLIAHGLKVWVYRRRD